VGFSICAWDQGRLVGRFDDNASGNKGLGDQCSNAAHAGPFLGCFQVVLDRPGGQVELRGSLGNGQVVSYAGHYGALSGGKNDHSGGPSAPLLYSKGI
jgi:hypothetical protein